MSVANFHVNEVNFSELWLAIAHMKGVNLQNFFSSFDSGHVCLVFFRDVSGGKTSLYFFEFATVGESLTVNEYFIISVFFYGCKGGRLLYGEPPFR